MWFSKWILPVRNLLWLILPLKISYQAFFFFLIPTLVKLSTKQLLDCVQAVPYCFYIIVSFYWYSSTVSVYIYVYTDNTIYIVYILVTVGDWGQATEAKVIWGEVTWTCSVSTVTKCSYMNRTAWKWSLIWARSVN